MRYKDLFKDKKRQTVHSMRKSPMMLAAKKMNEWHVLDDISRIYHFLHEADPTGNHDLRIIKRFEYYMQRYFCKLIVETDPFMQIEFDNYLCRVEDNTIFIKTPKTNMDKNDVGQMEEYLKEYMEEEGNGHNAFTVNDIFHKIHSRLRSKIPEDWAEAEKIIKEYLKVEKLRWQHTLVQKKIYTYKLNADRSNIPKNEALILFSLEKSFEINNEI